MTAGDRDDHGRPALPTSPRYRVLIVVSVSALIATACGTASSDPPVPRTGVATQSIRLELSAGSAIPGQVETTHLIGRGLDGETSSGLVEVTCGTRDTRVSHPVQGVTGNTSPPSGRAPEDQPFKLPAATAIRFAVPLVGTGQCVISRPVRTEA